MDVVCGDASLFAWGQGSQHCWESALPVSTLSAGGSASFAALAPLSLRNCMSYLSSSPAPPHPQMDLNYMAKHPGSEDVYSSFNLLMRRKPKVRGPACPLARRPAGWLAG